MIERIVIENFKSFKKVDLKLGRFNLFIGTNASGKSNFFDSLRVLRGIGEGSSVIGIFEEESGNVWPGIRGGSANAIYDPASGERPMECRMRIEFSTQLGKAEYGFAFNSEGATTHENLAKAGKEIFVFDGHDAYFKISEQQRSACYPNAFAGSQIVLAYQTGLAGAHKDFVEARRHQLRSIQFLVLEPGVLREYGSAAEVQRMGEQGENFASVVRKICNDAKKKQSYVSWLQELRPRELDDVTTLRGAVGEPLFALREDGREFPAPVLSDGTLRFAGLAAAFFQADMPQAIALEEIENGIHGSRLRVLVELLREQSTAADTQVLATTHSPLVLAWLKPEEYETTFLCKQDEETGETHILPLTQVPHFQDVIGKQPISELFAEGWMEAAL